MRLPLLPLLSVVATLPLLGAIPVLAAPAPSVPEKVPAVHRLGFDGLEIDVRKPVPADPWIGRPTARPESSAGRIYRIVKWGRPIGSVERKALVEAGFEVVAPLRDFAFLVRGSGPVERRLRAIPGVSFVGEMPVAARVSGELRRRLGVIGRSDIVPIRVVLNREEPSDRCRALLVSFAGGALPPGGPARADHGETLRADLPAPLLADALRELASLPEVAWIESFRRKELHNNSGDWVHQTFVSDSTPLFDDHALFGCGQIVAVADTGFDYDSCFVRDDQHGLPPVGTCEQLPCAAIEPDLLQRKTIAYYDWSLGATGSAAGCDHGNHVQTTIAGSSILDDGGASCSRRSYTNRSNYDGMAPGAKIVSQELGDDLDYINARGGSIWDLARAAWQAGARVHSSSWGGGCCGQSGCFEGCEVAYDSDAHDADAAAWEMKDLMLVFSAGNDHYCCSAPNEVGSPGTAKNVLTIGASGHDFSASRLAGYSSRGGTTDGRIKPTVTGQGSSVWSALADGWIGGTAEMNCDVCSMSGTSMAAPTIAGTSLLAREYLARGYYPTGRERPLDEIADPSGALLRALLISSGQHHENVANPRPNLAEGFGRVNLSEVLHFDGGGRRLWLDDDAVGLDTGESFETAIDVAAGQPLRVTLVWTDPPAPIGAMPALVDDLDLELVGPDGVVRFVTRDEELGPIATTDSSLRHDDRNTEEQIEIASPEAGSWTIRVHGSTVPMGPQPFALVATGSLDACSRAGTPNGVAAAPDGRNRIRVSWGAVAGAGSYRVFREADRCTGLALESVGSTTGTSLLDRKASANHSYCYTVVAVDPSGGCASFPSAGAVAKATGDCLAAPSFAGVGSAEASSGVSCGNDLFWAPATPACSGFGVRYNVYRSTRPDFTPSAANLVARCIDGTTWHDSAGLESGLTFHYVVRAEDSGTVQGGPCNGGKEDANLARAWATPSGAGSGGIGEWVDHGGDSTALLRSDGNWQLTRTHAKEGLYAWHNAPDGGVYLPQLCSSLTSPPLELGTGVPHVLSFWLDYDIEWQWDGLLVEVSTDGGTAWQMLAPRSAYPETLQQTLGNGCDWSKGTGVFSGPAGNQSLTGWQEYQIDLPSAFDGRILFFRFRFTSDPGLEYEGAYLDEVRLTGVRLPGGCRSEAAVSARFSASPAASCPGVPVLFTDETTGEPVSWKWKFGDGMQSVERNPSHTWSEVGTRKVTLEASGPGGTSTFDATYVVACSGSGFAPKLAIPGVARAAGAAGSFFKSTIWIAFPAATADGAPLDFELTWAPGPGFDAGNGARVPFTIRPGEALELDDPLGELFGIASDSSGVLTLWTPAGRIAPIQAVARTFNAASAKGTYGQFIEAVPLDGRRGLPFSVSFLEGLGGDETFRSNVGIVNPADASLAATIELFDQENRAAGSPITVDVPPRSVVQTNRVNEAAGSGNRKLFSARISANGPYFAYASKLDNRTSDPVFLPNTSVERAVQWIDGVASATGAEGTFFRTTLFLSNRRETSARVTIRFTPRGAAAPLASADVTLAPRRLVSWEDLLRDLFALQPDQAGAIRIEGDPVTAWARTWNDSADGSYGQFLPAFGAENLVSAGAKGWLLGLAENDGFRSNLGLVNPGTETTAVEVVLFGPGGAELGRRTESVPGGGALFLPKYLRTLTGRSDLSGIYAEIRPLSGPSVNAWASVVDNRSGDAIFVRLVR
jgi:PKD repeat protein